MVMNNRVEAMIQVILVVMRICSVAALSLMLAVVSAQVLARLLFNASGQQLNFMFSGSIEIASYALLLLIFAALPQSCAQGLVRVELFSRSWPAHWQRAFDRLWLVMVALFALAIASQAWNQTASSWRRGLTTQDLNLPMSVFYGYIVITSLCLMGAALFFAWRVDAVGRDG